MVTKGGYKLIDFGGVDISTSKTISGIYNKIANTGKRIVGCNITLGTTKFKELTLDVKANGTSYELSNSIIKITITNANAVVGEEQSSGSYYLLDLGEVDITQNSTKDISVDLDDIVDNDIPIIIKADFKQDENQYLSMVFDTPYTNSSLLPNSYKFYGLANYEYILGISSNITYNKSTHKVTISIELQ